MRTSGSGRIGYPNRCVGCGGGHGGRQGRLRCAAAAATRGGSERLSALKGAWGRPKKGDIVREPRRAVLVNSWVQMGTEQRLQASMLASQSSQNVESREGGYFPRRAPHLRFEVQLLWSGIAKTWCAAPLASKAEGGGMRKGSEPETSTLNPRWQHGHAATAPRRAAYFLGMLEPMAE